MLFDDLDGSASVSFAQGTMEGNSSSPTETISCDHPSPQAAESDFYPLTYDVDGLQAADAEPVEPLAMWADEEAPASMETTSEPFSIKPSIKFSQEEGIPLLDFVAQLDTSTFDVNANAQLDLAQESPRSGSLQFGSQLPAAADEGDGWSILAEAQRNAALGDPLSISAALRTGGFSFDGSAGLSLADGNLNALGFGVDYASKAPDGFGLGSSVSFKQSEGISLLDLGANLDTSAFDVNANAQLDLAEGNLLSGSLQFGSQLPTATDEGDGWSILAEAQRNAALGDPLSISAALRTGGFSFDGNAGLSLADGNLNALGFGVDYASKSPDGFGLGSSVSFKQSEGIPLLDLGAQLDTSAFDVNTNAQIDLAQGNLLSGSLQLGSQLPTTADEGDGWSILAEAQRNAALGDPLSISAALRTGGFSFNGNAGLSLADGALNKLGLGVTYTSEDELSRFSFEYAYQRTMEEELQAFTNKFTGAASFPIDKDWAARISGGLTLQDGVVNDASLGAELGYQLTPDMTLNLGANVFAKMLEGQLTPGFGLDLGLTNDVFPFLLSYTNWAGDNQFSLKTPLQLHPSGEAEPAPKPEGAR